DFAGIGRGRSAGEEGGTHRCGDLSAEVVAEDLQPRHARTIIAAPFDRRNIARTDASEADAREEVRRSLVRRAGKDIPQRALARLVEDLLDQLDRHALAGEARQG